MRDPVEADQIVPLAIGQRVDVEEISDRIGIEFPSPIPSIRAASTDGGDSFILLFGTEDGPYDHGIQPGKFTYIGLGTNGDQSTRIHGNSNLISAIDEPVPVFLFYKESADRDWQYRGQVSVLDYTTELRDGCERLVFRMEHQGSPAEEQDEREELPSNTTDAPTSSNEDLPLEDRYEKTIRNSTQAFYEGVKDAYNNCCAICGRQRMTPEGNPEVESAHIHPREDGGCHELQNGIALCRLHHWAFDNDWIGIREDYTIKVRDAPDIKGYDDFKHLEGQELYLPEDPELHPAKEFIRAKQRRQTLFDRE